jgi:hypothetical protein
VTDDPSVEVNVPETWLAVGGLKVATPFVPAEASSTSENEVEIGTVNKATTTTIRITTTIIAVFLAA